MLNVEKLFHSSSGINRIEFKLLVLLTSLCSCLVQNAKSALPAADWVASFDHILGAAVTTSILNSADNGNHGNAT
jgi:hypothetical protein